MNSQRRSNVTSACRTCKGRKKKCDGRRPSCSVCVDLQRQCVYDQSSDKRLSNRPHTTIAILEREIVELKARLAALEISDCSHAEVIKASATIAAAGLQQHGPNGKLSYHGPTAIPPRGDQSTPAKASFRWIPLPHPGIGVYPEPRPPELDSQESLELVNLYFTYLNGLMGFVDEAEFRRGMKGGHPTIGYSTFLHFALLTLAEHLSPGWQSHETRRGFARQAFELLEAELSAPQPTTVTGIMLLVIDTADSGQLSMSWVYSGIANRLAQDLGLHAEASDLIASGALSLQAVRLRNNAFCTAYTHDILLALYIGRSPSSAASDRSIRLDQAAEAATLASQGSDLHRTQVALVRICDILSEIMKLLYSVQRNHQISSTSIGRIALELDTCLPQMPPPLPESPASSLTPNSIALGALRETAVILLHQPFIREPRLGGACGRTCFQAAIATLRFARQYDLYYTIQKAPITMTQIMYVATSALQAVSACGFHESELASLQQSVEAIEELKRLLACLSQTWSAAAVALDALNRSASADDGETPAWDEPSLWNINLFDWPLFEGLAAF